MIVETADLLLAFAGGNRNLEILAEFYNQMVGYETSKFGCSRVWRATRTTRTTQDGLGRIRGITGAPLRAAVRLQNASTMQTVHSTATGHESPRGMQHRLSYAPVWKSQRGDAIDGGVVEVADIT